MRNTPVTIARRERDMLAGPQLKKMRYRRSRTASTTLASSARTSSWLSMSRTLTLPAASSLAAQDQDELGAHLISLFKLGLERTA